MGEASADPYRVPIRSLEQSWPLFAIVLVVLAALYLRFGVLAIAFWTTDGFNLRSETLQGVYQTLAAGDDVNERLGSLFGPLLVVFSVVMYAERVSVRTWILVLVLVGAVGMCEYLIIVLRSSSTVQKLMLSNVDPTVFLRYCAQVEDSLVGHLLLLLGISQVNQAKRAASRGS